MNRLNKYIFVVMVAFALLVASCVSSMAFEKFSRVIIFDVCKFISNDKTDNQSNKQDTIGFIVKRTTGMFSDVVEDTYMFATIQEQIDCKIVRIDMSPDQYKRYSRISIYCE